MASPSAVVVQPRPSQEGGIRLWIAGGGEKVTLPIAAQYADYTNFRGDPDGFTKKSAVLRAHCADVGTDFELIVRSSNDNVTVGSTEIEVDQRLRVRPQQAIGGRL